MNNLPIKSDVLSRFTSPQNDIFEKISFVNSPFSNPEEWESNFRHFYIRELDIVDYSGRDSSFQYYIISNRNFKEKYEKYISLIEDMSESEILNLIYDTKNNKDLDRDFIHERLFGMREAYRLSYHIIAFEYRALIEAIKINKLSKELEEKLVRRCQRCLTSSFNPNYHKS